MLFFRAIVALNLRKGEGRIGQMDRGTVFRSALLALGNYQFKEGSPTEDPCVLWYPIVLRQMNAARNWTFARKRAKLGKPKESAVEGGRYEYGLPHDFLKLLHVYTGSGSGLVGKPMLFAGGKLEVGEDGRDSVVIEYICDLVATDAELPDSNPDFCNAVIYALASRIAPQVAGDFGLVDSMEARSRDALSSAILYDRQQIERADGYGSLRGGCCHG